MSLPRIVITGMGGLCALGTDAPAIWQAMREGRSGIGEITSAPLHGLSGRIGAEIKALPDAGFDRKRLITMDRFSLLAVMAATEAVGRSGLSLAAVEPARMGAVVGTGIYGSETLEENYRALLVEGRPRAGVFTVPRVMPGAPA